VDCNVLRELLDQRKLGRRQQIGDFLRQFVLVLLQKIRRAVPVVIDEES